MKSTRPCLEIKNLTQETVVCARAQVADTTLTRLFGLLGRATLTPGEGLLIRPSSGVHTWGMSFAIDVIALGRDQCVVGLWRGVGPWRVRALSLTTRSVLELAPGAIDRSATMLGDRFQVLERLLSEDAPVIRSALLPPASNRRAESKASSISRLGYPRPD